jgi:hypothetical protein
MYPLAVLKPNLMEVRLPQLNLKRLKLALQPYVLIYLQHKLRHVNKP